MKPIKSPEHRITVKIGLILIVVLLFFSGLYVYSNILKKNIDAQKKEGNGQFIHGTIVQ